MAHSLWAIGARQTFTCTYIDDRVEFFIDSFILEIWIQITSRNNLISWFPFSHWWMKWTCVSSKDD